MANGRPLPIRSSRTADPDYLFWTNSYHILLQVGMQRTLGRNPDCWDRFRAKRYPTPRLVGKCVNPRRVGEEIRQDSELRSLPSMLPDMEISVLPRAAIP